MTDKIETITLEMSKISWPIEIVNNDFPLDVLKWLVSDDLSDAAIAFAANKKVHITMKTRKQKDGYLVSGGFISFLMLMKMGWSASVECILDKNIDEKELAKIFCSDISHSIFSLKGGSLACAAKAALLKRLFEIGEQTGIPPCFKIAPKHLVNSNELLKEFVGYDSRSYKKVIKKGIEPEDLSSIESILNAENLNGPQNKGVTVVEKGKESAVGLDQGV